MSEDFSDFGFFFHLVFIEIGMFIFRRKIFKKFCYQRAQIKRYLFKSQLGHLANSDLILAMQHPAVPLNNSRVEQTSKDDYSP